MPTPKESLLEQDIAIWKKETGGDRNNLLPVIQKIQTKYHGITKKAMLLVAEEFNVRPAEVFSLVRYYPSFSQGERGLYHIQICNDICCELKNKRDLVSQITSKFGIPIGGITPDGRVSLDYVRCLGMCDKGPAVLVNNQLYTSVNNRIMDDIIQKVAGGNLEDPADSSNYNNDFWSGHKAISSYHPIEPGQACRSIHRKSPEQLFSILAASKMLSPVQLDGWQDPTEPTPEKPVLICNTDHSSPGSFKERILLADHYDLFLEGLYILAYVYGAGQVILYIHPTYESMIPVLYSYCENINLYLRMGNSDGNFEVGNLYLDIRVSPRFHSAASEQNLISAITSNTMNPIGSHNQAGKFIFLDVDTCLKTGLFLAKENRCCGECDQSGSPDQDIYSVSGDCQLPGVYELTRHTTISDMLNLVGAADAIAVQVGGITGQVLSPALFSNNIKEVNPHGNTNILIYGPQSNIYEITDYLLQFFAQESCGKCSPCREGTKKMLECFHQTGKSFRFGLHEMVSIAECMQITSRCKFGQMAAGVYLSLHKNFRELN
jgi:[NiFe] hydrogenase diaphorase moiety large subunit